MAFENYSGYGKYSVYEQYAGYVATGDCHKDAMELEKKTEEMVINKARRLSDVNMTSRRAYFIATKLVGWGMGHFKKELTQKYSTMPALHDWVQIEINDNSRHFCSTFIRSGRIQRALRRIDI